MIHRALRVLAALVFLPLAGAEFLPLDQPEPVVFRRLTEPLTVRTVAKPPASWLLILPVLQASDNVSSQPPGAIQPLRYHLKRLEEAGMALDAGKLANDIGPGTIYLAAWSGPESIPTELQTHEPLHRLYSDRIVQIVSRAGDTYLDFLRELTGTPFVMGPGVVNGYHQTDERLGSDCAALATYGARRLGLPVPYAGPRGIQDYLERLHPLPLHPGNDGLYYGSDGQPFSTDVLQGGEIFHFGQQVSVFVRDEGVRGILDGDDVVFESWGQTPREITIRQSDFFRAPLSIYRWKTRLGSASR